MYYKLLTCHSQFPLNIHKPFSKTTELFGQQSLQIGALQSETALQRVVKYDGLDVVAKRAIERHGLTIADDQWGG